MTNNISFIFYFFCYYLHCDDIVCMHHYICVKSKPLIHLIFLWNSTTTLQYKYIIMCIFFFNITINYMITILNFTMKKYKRGKSSNINTGNLHLLYFKLQQMSLWKNISTPYEFLTGANGRLNYVFQTSPDVLLVKVKSCLCCFRCIIILNNFTYIFFPNT